MKIFFLFITLLTSISHSLEITILTQPVDRYSSDSWCHPAVTSSLLRGLEKLEINFNYNPKKEVDVHSTVVVLSNTDALHQAIEWKKAGKIKKLLAGPNLVIGPLDHDGVILSPYIDRYLVNSNWTKVAYIEDAPMMSRNITIWPSGIDPYHWNPLTSKSTKKNKVMVYWKTEPEEFCEEVEKILIKYGWDPLRIRYGAYDTSSFKQTLETCTFAVFISRSESQGIALAETWSMDVPTLAWNPNELVINNRKYSESSACPYLTSTTGFEWKYFDEFERLLELIPNNLNSFYPRKWVMENISDTASVSALLSIIKDI